MVQYTATISCYNNNSWVAYPLWGSKECFPSVPFLCLTSNLTTCHCHAKKYYSNFLHQHFTQKHLLATTKPFKAAILQYTVRAALRYVQLRNWTCSYQFTTEQSTVITTQSNWLVISLQKWWPCILLIDCIRYSSYSRDLVKISGKI